MKNASEILTEIINHFAKTGETPGDWWAHDDAFESYCLDHIGKDETKLWIDLNKDGSIGLLWKPQGDGSPLCLTFTVNGEDNAPT